MERVQSETQIAIFIRKIRLIAEVIYSCNVQSFMLRYNMNDYYYSSNFHRRISCNNLGTRPPD
jgi:hypothetical protein